MWLQMIWYKCMDWLYCRCYCLLHEQDAMGAILKQRKDLKTAETLEEIELKLWGVLNEWDPAASSTCL